MCLVNQVFFDVRIFEILCNTFSAGIEIENRLGSEKKGKYTPSENSIHEKKSLSAHLSIAEHQIFIAYSKYYTEHGYQ
jgi:hypothetical protein